MAGISTIIKSSLGLIYFNLAIFMDSPSGVEK
jgi:hypothetical protein